MPKLHRPQEPIDRTIIEALAVLVIPPDLAIVGVVVGFRTLVSGFNLLYLPKLIAF